MNSNALKGHPERTTYAHVSALGRLRSSLQLTTEHGSEAAPCAADVPRLCARARSATELDGTPWDDLSRGFREVALEGRESLLFFAWPR
jgi:hypothetical protein